MGSNGGQGVGRRVANIGSLMDAVTGPVIDRLTAGLNPAVYRPA